MAGTHTRSSIWQEEPNKKQDQEQEEGDQETTKRATSHPKNMKALINRGAWTAEEDTKLAEVIEIYGPRRWTSIASKAGLNRCGKSCRLRWMNYLRPNIKRGNISDQEEDLILRLHKLLGNRWSLIAGRLPGRTDNEIKNYWNSHLSKKLKQGEDQLRSKNSVRKPEPKMQSRRRVFSKVTKNRNENEKARNTEVDNRSKDHEEENSKEEDQEREMEVNVDDFFDFTNEKLENLEWVSRFLELR